MNYKKLFTALIGLLILSSCGQNSGSTSSKFISGAYLDIQNKSTLNFNALKNLPRVVDLKDQMTSVKLQDERNSCSFFTAISLIEWAIKKQMKVEVNLSEEYLIYATKKVGFASKLESGTEFDNLSVAIDRKVGFLLEKDWPYQPRWFGRKYPCKAFNKDNFLAPLECFTHSAPPREMLSKRISADGFSINKWKAKSTNDIIIDLAKNRAPLILGVPTNDKGWPESGNVQFNEVLRKECLNNYAGCGMHAITITGYDLNKKVFFFKNSWGAAWGKDGYGTLPFDYMDKYVDQEVVSVSLDKDISLPKEFDKESDIFNELKLSSIINADSSIDLKISRNLLSEDYHYFEVLSTVVEKTGEGEASDKNTKVVQDITQTKKMWDLESDKTRWDSKNPLILKFSAKQMQNVDLNSKKLFLRTSFYMYTDNESHKMLKRIYHPLN